jgi:phenylacetate-CoA ligase
MAQDTMLLRVECAAPDAALREAVAASVREVTKLRAEIELVSVGSLPNDGKVIEDTRSYR